MEEKEETATSGIDLIDFPSLMKILGISEGSGRNALKKGRLPTPFKLPGGRKLYWRKVDIEKFLEEAARNAAKNSK